MWKPLFRYRWLFIWSVVGLCLAQAVHRSLHGHQEVLQQSQHQTASAASNLKERLPSLSSMMGSLSSLFGGLLGMLKVKTAKAGCVDSMALNYDDEATQDDNSCQFPEKRSPLDDGRYRYYRSDLDPRSPFFIDPELRRIWRNTHHSRGELTVEDIDMSKQQKLVYGLISPQPTGPENEQSTAQRATVLPVGEPIPQDALETNDNSPADASGPTRAHSSSVPTNSMGVPADTWPNPINIPNYKSVPV